MQDINPLSEEGFIEILQQKVCFYETSVKNFDFEMCLLRKRYQQRVLLLTTTESRDQVKCFF